MRTTTPLLIAGCFLTVSLTTAACGDGARTEIASQTAALHKFEQEVEAFGASGLSAGTAADRDLLTAVVDWVELASVVPEVIFWFLLSRHAWRLRVREEA